jgi:ABC-2 type transport system ATP-binding protein
MPKRAAGEVKIENLTKRYGPLEALRGVSLEIAPGESFGLLGPNGAGKTSLLECALGLRRPDAGTITIGGFDTQRQPELARVAVGALLQEAALPDAITPREALAFFASFYGSAAAVGPLLERFGLSAKAGARFSSLSGGQRQRLCLALALINEPRVVILDEPTAGLDVAARRELHLLIRDLRASGQTVLFSTHQVEEAAQLCDRLAILHEGRILAVGTPAELIARTGALPQVKVRTARPLGQEITSALPALQQHRTEAEVGWLTTTDVGETTAALLFRLKQTDNALLDLQILQPSLEDAFVVLTGRPWVGAETQEGGP